MSDSVRPQRWQPTRLPCPCDSPGKNTGVGCHFLRSYQPGARHVWEKDGVALSTEGNPRVRLDGSGSLRISQTDGGVSGVSSSCGARGGFLPRHDKDLREPLVRRTSVLLPGESQGQGSLVGCRLWGRTELDTTDMT